MGTIKVWLRRNNKEEEEEETIIKALTVLTIGRAHHTANGSNSKSSPTPKKHVPHGCTPAEQTIHSTPTCYSIVV